MRKTVSRAKSLLVMAVIAMAAWVIQAGPGQGIHSGPWMISPYVDVAGTYDSNIDQAAENKQDDYFLTSEAGLRASYSAFMIDASALGFAGYRNYADATDRDFDSYGEVVSVKYGLRERLQIQADESLRHIEDVDSHGSESAIGGVSVDSILDAATRAERNVSHIGLSAGRDLTDKMELDVGYRYDASSYRDSTDLADLTGHAAQFESAYRVTDKSAAFATFFGGLQENSVLDGAADYYGVRLGAKTRGTDKVSIKAGAGVKQYNRADGIGDDETGFNFDAQAVWLVSDKVLLNAGGRNGTQMSSVLTDNASDFMALWAGVTYRVLTTTALSLSSVYRMDEYLDPVTLENGSTIDREDKGLGLRARADYQTPAAFMRVYAEATYEATDSTATDFDETRFSVGTNLRY